MPARFLAYDIVKRFFDIIMAAGFLIILSPILLIIAVLIKIDSPGPILFRQERTGRNGKIFHILKFRSMVADNDVRDNSCEDKYTKVGKILRRTSLDELPQFINVLIGQMSFIGPRPWIPEYWTNMNEIERERGKVRPGITGLAAAKGRNGLTVFQKIAYDLEYVRNYSLKQDIKVIFITIKTLFDKEVVNVGKSGIHDEIEDLKKEDDNPKIRVIVKTDPLVSVVVSLSNGAEYIGEVISTALGRECKKIELIAMNNNYSSKAKKLIKKLDSTKLKIIESRGNVVDNTGLGEDSSRFWCFVDTRESLRLNRIIGRIAMANNSEPAIEDTSALA